MRYSMLSNVQLFLLALLMSIFAAALISINMYYMDVRTLPKVYTDKAGACFKVENYGNGDAYNCNDVGVILRRYREVTNEKDTKAAM